MRVCKSTDEVWINADHIIPQLFREVLVLGVGSGNEKRGAITLPTSVFS